MAHSRHSPTPTLRAVGVVVAGPVLVAYALATMAIGQGPGDGYTYPAASPELAAYTLVAGLSLVAAGLTAATVAPSLRVGGLTVASGVLWFAPVWVGWYHGPELVRSIAVAAAPLWLPTAVHLLLRGPHGRLVTGADRWLVRVGYAGSGVVAVVRALLRDPFADPWCWADCQVNGLVIYPMDRLGNAIGEVEAWFGAGLTVAAVVLAARDLLRAGPVRWPWWPALSTAVTLAAAVSGYVYAVMNTPLEDPSDPAYRTAYVARCAAAVLVAVTVLVAVGFTRARRRAVERLAEAPHPADVESALRQATGDPVLTVAYWLPVSRKYVDSDGQAVTEPAAGPGGMVTPLVRGEQVLAVVKHQASLLTLEQSLGSGLRLALENMLLRVEVLAHLADLTESRRRIVEAADTRRRALERDLHDGAQQELAALLYRLRAMATSAPDGRLAKAAALAESALDELRAIAHGIYPAVLDHAGLRAAFATLADTAEVPVEFEDRLSGRRYPAMIERTAYVVAAEAIAGARDASHVEMIASEDGDALVISFPSRSLAEHVADRVGAAGGRVVEDDGMVRVELPCGW